MTVALYVDPRGPYPALLGADRCYDKRRDARTYFGPEPVVAHPPCQLWGKLARVNYARWGGEHNRPGNDGGLFAHALSMVRTFGGVLEHPASSYAWEAYGLSRPPSAGGWRYAGGYEWTCEVWQSAYGHLADKRTWLLYVGLRPPLEARWEQYRGSHQISKMNWGKKTNPRPAIQGAQGSLTPPLFAEYLIRLAEHAVRP